MKKFTQFSIVLSLLFVVLAAPYSQAVASENEVGENDSIELHNQQENGKTRVLGIIRDESNKPVWKANVSVRCNSFTENSLTNRLGVYLVKFNRSQCKSGDTVHVTASKDGMSGGGRAVVQEYLRRVDLAIVSFAIPEFGLITGALASLGGLGAYLKMRRGI